MLRPYERASSLRCWTPVRAPELWRYGNRFGAGGSTTSLEPTPIPQPVRVRSAPVLQFSMRTAETRGRPANDHRDWRRRRPHGNIEDAFPGVTAPGGRDPRPLRPRAKAHGLLRPLSAAELSDGTLRYLLLVAALLSPRPPSLMVLNEPETSLHADLLPALARLIARASDAHPDRRGHPRAKISWRPCPRSGAQPLCLVKEFGATTLEGVAPSGAAGMELGFALSGFTGRISAPVIEVDHARG